MRLRLEGRDLPFLAQQSLLALNLSAPFSKASVSSHKSLDARKQKWFQEVVLFPLPSWPAIARWHLTVYTLTLSLQPDSSWTLSLGQKQLPGTADSAGHWPLLQEEGEIQIQSSHLLATLAQLLKKTATVAGKLSSPGLPGEVNEP